MRDAREIFSALKSNVDQIITSLQDGLMLFTRDSRVVLVSAAIEGFLGRSRGELLGRTVKEIFSAESALGGVMLDAFRLHHNVEAREIEASNGRRVHVSLDFIQEKGTQLGALLTMRGAWSSTKTPCWPRPMPSSREGSWSTKGGRTPSRSRSTWTSSHTR